MSIAFPAERKMLADDEAGQIARSHYPLLEQLPRGEIVELAQWLRRRHGRAQDILRDRRRANRGKSAARPAADGEYADRGLAAKKRIFAGGLKRVNARLGALADAARREARLARLRAVLAAKQAALPTHPDAGQAPSHGMRPATHRKPRRTIDPGRIGSTSQAVKNAQARRDAKG